MKSNIIIFAVVMLLSVLTGCKTQMVSCEDVKHINEISWLARKSPHGQKLESVDKIVYKLPQGDTNYIGYNIQYEPMCCDIPSQFICDCDGNIITEYGGYDGCMGECDIEIISRVNIYK